MGKDTKYSKGRLLSILPQDKALGTMAYRIIPGAILLSITCMTGMLFMVFWQNVEGSDGPLSYVYKQIVSPLSEELPGQWNYSSFRFDPYESDWDEQRANWRHGVGLQVPEGERPRILMVTGSSPEPTYPSILSYLLLRAGKNKLDYCRIHNIEFFYNLGIPDKRFSEGSEKLPIVRMLMLQHPEVEWIWWMDADAILTNVSFEPPFAKLEHYNLVLHGENDLLFGHRPISVGLNTANFILRNCQWSLDLLDTWASMGTASAREEFGKFLGEVFMDREVGLPGDDQSGLVAMLAQDKRFRVGRQRWTPMVKLVKEGEYAMSANGTVVDPQFEELNVGNGQRMPFVTHFAGCLPTFSAAGDPISSERFSACQKQLVRAFDSADNQVYIWLGFQPRPLGKSVEPMTRYPTELVEHEKENNTKEYWIPPKYSDWDERRREWIERHRPTEKDRVILVSGSAPKPCSGQKKASQIPLRGLKNAIDYGRINGVTFFYNHNVVDKNLTGWWSKLPLVRLLMLKNPSVEWIWWMDSDAVFTDMDFQLPFDRYDDAGVNFVMYGSEPGLYEKFSYTGINTGNFLIRNCQWSLDLLDTWAAIGATEELRAKNVELVTAVLSDRSRGWNVDDQTALAYLLITQREKWGPRVLLEQHFAMSGHWVYWVTTFETGNIRPFVTHFAGCHPCQEMPEEECINGMDRTYNYADNQVLAKYGFRHKALNSSVLQEIERESSRALSPGAEEGGSHEHSP